MNIPIRKILKTLGMCIASLLLLMFLLPMLFPDAVARQIKQWANQSIEGKLDFSKARLSFFRHFPNLTLTIYDYSLNAARPFDKDTLIGGKALGFGINLASLFRSSFEVNKFFVEESNIRVTVDAAGNASYDILKPQQSTATTGDTASAHLNIEGIFIKNCNLVYNDRSIPMLIVAEGLNYEGKGDLANNQFDLVSNLSIEQVDFVYDGTPYVQRKRLQADLITGINTSSLEFRFEHNELLINKLPIDFTGSMRLLKDGYDIDLDLVSGTTDFGNIFSAIPPEYNSWFANTAFSGTSQITLDMAGAYRAATGRAPDLTIHLWVNDGSISNNKAPAPLEHFYVGADIRLPALNPDSLVLRIDSLKFIVDGQPTRGAILMKGITSPWLEASIESKLNLATLQRALAIPGYNLAGELATSIHLNGVADWKAKKIPVTDISVKLKNGLIKTPYYPNAISELNIDAAIQSPSGSTSDLAMHLQPVGFLFEDQPFSANAHLHNFDNLSYDINAKGILDLGKIYQVFKIDHYNVSGWLQTDVSMKGTQADAMASRYQQLRNSGTITMKHIEFSSDDYPYPFMIPEGLLEIQQDKAWLRNTKLAYHNNKFLLNGYAGNFAGYFFQGSTLVGNMRVSSPSVTIDDFMAGHVADSTLSDSSLSSGVVLLPANLDLSLTADFDKVSYTGTTLKNFSSTLNLKAGKLTLQKTGFNIAGATVSMNGSYFPQQPNLALFTAALKADSFDIKKAYNEVPIFRELASSAAFASGQVSVDYHLKGQLDEQMQPVYHSISGDGVLKLENVQVKGMKLFGAISKATGKDSINNPNLKAVVIKSSIANNLITIERTKMKVYGFRPRMEGQVSLDGKLNLKFRLGLPPFGIIGIPMTITGSSANPIVKMRKGKEEDMLEEEPDEE